MKKFFFIFPILALGLFFPLTGLWASIFPNDTKMAYVVATGAGSDCTDLLSATTTPRTLLWGKITTNSKESANINVSGINFLDSTYSLEGVAETFAPLVVPAGDTVSCTRTTGKSFIYRIAYVDYDITLVSNDINVNINGGTASTTIGTIGTTTMISNIENIGYIATTTQLANGQTFTQAVYNLPFNLFIFMAVLFFAVMLIVVLSIYFIKTKKDDY